MASGYVERGIQLNCKCVSFHKRKSFKSKDMKMFSAFFSLSIMFIFGRLFPEEDLSKRKSGSVIEGTVLNSNRDRQQRSSISKTTRVLDFSADNDFKPDTNGKYTGATLDAGALPQSFTICSAFMVEEWTSDYQTADLFTLFSEVG